MGRRKAKKIINSTLLESDESSTRYQLNYKFESNKQKEPKIQKYKDPETEVSIENWLKAYELVSNYFNWKDYEKVVYLTNYLKGEALNWFIETLDETKEWSEVKNNLTDRFSTLTCDPTKAMVELTYDPKIGIKKYFEEKKKLGVKAKMNKEQILSLMKLGLNHEMKSYFISTKFES